MTLSELLSSQQLIAWAVTSDQVNFTVERTYLPDLDLHITLEAPGVVSLIPKQGSQRAIVLSCAVHGNETAPIELCEQLFEDILTGSIVLDCRLLLVVANLEAMRQGVRFCDENLNRLFVETSPEHDNLEVRRAEELKPLIANFFQADDSERIHFDLHTAIRDSKYTKFAIYPYLPEGNWDEDLMQWLTNADIEAILLSNKLSGTFSCYSSLHYGAHALTVELGKARPFGKNDHDTLSEFKVSLQHLLSDAKTLRQQPTPRKPRVFQVVAEVLRHNEKFALNLADDFANFTEVDNGYQLTEDGAESFVIQGYNQAIVFPNDKVPVGQRVALVIEPRQGC
jgi:succinylglutamate desuccinylase